MKFNIQIKKIHPDLYLANCPELPGCLVQADSETRAIARIQEAIKLVVTSYRIHFEKVPIEES